MKDKTWWLYRPHWASKRDQDNDIVLLDHAGALLGWIVDRKNKAQGTYRYVEKGKEYRYGYVLAFNNSSKGFSSGGEGHAGTIKEAKRKLEALL